MTVGSGNTHWRTFRRIRVIPVTPLAPVCISDFDRVASVCNDKLAIMRFQDLTSVAAMLTPAVVSQALPPYNFTIPPMLRFQCSQLVIDRIDPLVNPSVIPSPHLHQIVGGNSFNASLSHDLPSQSTCTSCTFSEDFSNYWTAVMYFRARNGTYKRVPQFESEGLRGNGGITVYYIPDALNKTSVTAFKPGFRMLAGDAASSTPVPSARKVCHRCMPKGQEPLTINCGAPDSQEFPTGQCGGGIRSVITFPTCWNGVDLDSPDHKSHMAYTLQHDRNDVGPTGKCPEGFPVVVPQVMYEVMWDVS
jgi:hypothetical protein